MSFVPTIPLGGLAGWRFLEKTAARQQAAFEKGPALAREVAYFREKIGTITSAEDLVRDRRLLKVALGAFGLEGEIDKRFFVRKVLEEGTENPKAMARRLSEPAYAKLAAAFGFGNAGGPQTGKPAFVEKIVAQYKERQFEAAVGEVDNAMRLAMNFRREIAELAAREDGGSWFSVLGSRPLREVIQGALGLPKEFVKIDIDRQRDMIRQRMQSAFGDGSLAFFREPANVEKVLTRFLARAQAEGAMGAGATSPALQLLQMGSAGSEGLFNLLTARR